MDSHVGQDKLVDDILNEDKQWVDTLPEADMQVDIRKDSNRNADILREADMLVVDRLLGDTLLEVDSLMVGIHVEEGRVVHLDSLDVKIYLFH